MIVRWSAIVLLLLTFVLVEAVIAPALAVRGVPPDLTVLAVVGVALRDGPAAGARVGFVAGLLRDALAASGGLMGPWILALLMVGYAVGVVGPYVVRGSLATRALLGGAGALGAWLIAGGLDLALGSGSVHATAIGTVGSAGPTVASLRELGIQALVAAAWGVVLGPLVGGVTQRLWDRTGTAAAPQR